MRRNIALIVFLITLQSVSAQFNFFGNVFGGHQEQHQQHQQRPASSQWATYSESVPCSQYLCPGTLECVTQPVDCPCPSPEDIKCTIPDTESSRGDGTVVCTRGSNECAEVARLMKKGRNKQ